MSDNYSGRQLFLFLGVPLSHSKYTLEFTNHDAVEQKKLSCNFLFMTLYW